MPLYVPCAGVVEELIDCSGGDEISLETGTARKLEALMASLDRNRCGTHGGGCTGRQAGICTIVLCVVQQVLLLH